MTAVKKKAKVKSLQLGVKSVKSLVPKASGARSPDGVSGKSHDFGGKTKHPDWRLKKEKCVLMFWTGGSAMGRGAAGLVHHEAPSDKIDRRKSEKYLHTNKVGVTRLGIKFLLFFLSSSFIRCGKGLPRDAFA